MCFRNPSLHCTFLFARNFHSCTFRHSNRIQPFVSCVGFPSRRRFVAGWTVVSWRTVRSPVSIRMRIPIDLGMAQVHRHHRGWSSVVSIVCSSPVVDRRSFRSSIGPCHVVLNVWSRRVPRGATWRLRGPIPPTTGPPKPKRLSGPYPIPRRGARRLVSLLEGTRSSGTVFATPCSRRGFVPSISLHPPRATSRDPPFLPIVSFRSVESPFTWIDVPFDPSLSIPVGRVAADVVVHTTRAKRRRWRRWRRNSRACEQ